MPWDIEAARAKGAKRPAVFVRAANAALARCRAKKGTDCEKKAIIAGHVASNAAAHRR